MPVSFPRLPTFQASSNRAAKSLIGIPPRVGKIATAIWVPVAWS